MFPERKAERQKNQKRECVEMKVLKEAVKRTEEDRKNLTETVSRMIEEVRCKKDEALKSL